MGLDMYLSAQINLSKDDPRNDAIVALFKPERTHPEDGETSDYISGWHFSKDDRFDTLVSLVGFTPDEGSPAFYLAVVDGCAQLSVTVAYWRKANQIHRWFVENVQDDVDDCGTYLAHGEALAGLVAICEAVLDDPAKAPDTLPPQAGFFFGNTEIDEWYMENLKYTVMRLKEVLLHPALRGAAFFYESSW